MTQLSGAPNPASGPVSGWIQPIVMLLVLPPELAPLMPEPQALRTPPAPATTAPAPTPFSSDRRAIDCPGSGLSPALSGPMSSPPSFNAVKPVEFLAGRPHRDLPPEWLPAHLELFA